MNLSFNEIKPGMFITVSNSKSGKFIRDGEVGRIEGERVIRTDGKVIAMESMMRFHLTVTLT